MGIYDRDYYREPTGGNGLGIISGWSVTTWLIAINVAVFVIDSLLIDREYPGFHGPLFRLGYFSVETAVVHLQLWRFFTLQFLHVNLQHIFFNMLALFFFGPIVEDMLGARRYLAFYLLCGIASGVMIALLSTMHVLGDDFATPCVGASGSIFGVMVGAAVVAPNLIIRYDFIFPIKLRTLALVMVGFAAYQVLYAGPNAGGEAGHIGGAILGYLLIKNPNLLAFANQRRRSNMRYRR